MNNDNEKISEGLNQIFEIINAKGDIGELKESVDKAAADVKAQHDKK